MMFTCQGFRLYVGDGGIAIDVEPSRHLEAWLILEPEQAAGLMRLLDTPKEKQTCQ